MRYRIEYDQTNSRRPLWLVLDDNGATAATCTREDWATQERDRLNAEHEAYERRRRLVLVTSH